MGVKYHNSQRRWNYFRFCIYLRNANIRYPNLKYGLVPGFSRNNF
jgi:hypothetical protein